MTVNEVAVRAIVALGLTVVLAALVYALSSGRVFLFPFLLILGLPMVALLRKRPPPPPPPRLPQPPTRMSLN
jgi:hypothetical protein